MKNNLYELHYRKDEDRVTEVLIKLLEKSTNELTDNFLTFCIGQDNRVTDGEYSYGTQLFGDIGRTTKKGFILAISESGKIKTSNRVNSGKRDGKPDGFIYEQNQEISVLIETKIKGNELDRQQLMAHCLTCLPNCNVIEEIYLKWEELRNFFYEEQKRYETYHKNWLLIKEFQDFCDEYEVGRDENDFMYLIKKYDNAEGILDNLHHYIKNRFPDVFVKKQKFTAIDYKASENQEAFFTIWYSYKNKNPLIVFKPASPLGILIDMVVHKIGGEIIETSYDYKVTESFMRISDLKKSQLSILYKLIDICYETTFVKQKTWSVDEWIKHFSLSINNLEKSRIGREDKSFFVKGFKEVDANNLYNRINGAIMKKVN
ncbi:hypothetical protein [Metabacillus niabensis]|uniref:hypothetical protein n=1 Tax=Metabacillus niabensis TaxID=324854 RepID=UPI0039A2B28C